jgi:hypothetical protein
LIRVLIADDQEMVRDGFAMILDAQDDIEVVGVAADGPPMTAARPPSPLRATQQRPQGREFQVVQNGPILRVLVVPRQPPNPAAAAADNELETRLRHANRGWCSSGRGRAPARAAVGVVGDDVGDLIAGGLRSRTGPANVACG